MPMHQNALNQPTAWKKVLVPQYLLILTFPTMSKTISWQVCHRIDV